jgi:hypothetical protein
MIVVRKIVCDCCEIRHLLVGNNHVFILKTDEDKGVVIVFS